MPYARPALDLVAICAFFYAALAALACLN